MKLKGRLIVLTMMGVELNITGFILLLTSILLWISEDLDKYILHTCGLDPMDTSMLSILFGMIILLIGSCLLYKKSILEEGEI